MSLTSFLLSSTAPVDAGLDNLFKAKFDNKSPHLASEPGPSKESSKKRKIQAEKDVDTPSKRAKPSLSEKKSKLIVQNEQQSDNTAKPRKKDVKGKERAKESAAESGGKDDNSDVENAYTAGKSVQKTTEDLENSDESDGDDIPTTLIHESLQKKVKKASRTPKQKYVPEDETPNLRDQRTIFVGNLPIELASKKVSRCFLPLLSTLNKSL